jgi:hypothetical protein
MSSAAQALRKYRGRGMKEIRQEGKIKLRDLEVLSKKSEKSYKCTSKFS